MAQHVGMATTYGTYKSECTWSAVRRKSLCCFCIFIVNILMTSRQFAFSLQRWAVGASDPRGPAVPQGDTAYIYVLGLCVFLSLAWPSRLSYALQFADMFHDANL